MAQSMLEKVTCWAALDLIGAKIAANSAADCAAANFVEIVVEIAFGGRPLWGIASSTAAAAVA